MLLPLVPVSDGRRRRKEESLVPPVQDVEKHHHKEFVRKGFGRTSLVCEGTCSSCGEKKSSAAHWCEASAQFEVRQTKSAEGH